MQRRMSRECHGRYCSFFSYSTESLLERCRHDKRGIVKLAKLVATTAQQILDICDRRASLRFVFHAHVPAANITPFDPSGKMRKQ